MEPIELPQNAYIFIQAGGCMEIGQMNTEDDGVTARQDLIHICNRDDALKLADTLVKVLTGKGHPDKHCYRRLAHDSHLWMMSGRLYSCGGREAVPTVEETGEVAEHDKSDCKRCKKLNDLQEMSPGYEAYLQSIYGIQASSETRAEWEE